MANIYNFIFDGCSFLWAYQIQVIGSAFAGLAIYSYFYRELDKEEEKADLIIKKANLVTIRINKMTEKSEVQTILDAVAGFNDSINGFKDNIIKTVKEEIKELEERLLSHFDKEIGRTNKEVKEIKIQVRDIEEKAFEDKAAIGLVKSKLAWAVGIGVFFSTLIIGVAQYFVFKMI